MVVFVCSSCGNSLKKNQVEKHWASHCRHTKRVSCMDCGKDFNGMEYNDHIKCISEDQKYGGSQYKPKEMKGEKKQDAWIANIKEKVASSDNMAPNLKLLLTGLVEYNNIPRKKAKFKNFLLNSVRVSNHYLIEDAWAVFEAANAKQPDADKENVSKPPSTPAEQNSENKESETGKKKKKKNNKNLENGHVKAEVETTPSIDVKEEKRERKRKKKNKFANKSEPVPQVNEQVNGEKKKGKKKKRKYEEAMEATTNEQNTPEEENSKKKKEKKGKKKRKIENGEAVETIDEQIMQEEEKGGRKEKKGKKKRKLENGDEAAVAEQATSEGEKPKKKKKLEAQSNGINGDLPLVNGNHDQEMDTENTDSNSTSFKWKVAIRTVLEGAPEEGMKISKVRKKVLALYLSSAKATVGCPKSEEQLSALFTKKLGVRNDKYIVDKDRVKLRKE